MKKHTFILDLPSTVSAQRAAQEGMKHIEQAFDADFSCQGGKPTKDSPGMETWNYSYLVRG
ncbi:hypothetical protein BHQ21_15315 [Mycobacterium sherrisii]|uniref:Uncharacterized protein n=1 Tax=Mycobacterium sherrisii TaxID=243061 RepID=A0A1E3SU68_9MYCO|nr:hypothetical protein BHQ21_15315 [Mycobacterium sherrisii]